MGRVTDRGQDRASTSFNSCRARGLKVYRQNPL